MLTTENDAIPADLVDVYRGLPRRVQVGQYTFRIFIVPASHEKLDGSDGMTYTGDNRVYLSESLSLQTAVNTVVHELTHCVNWARDVTDDSDEEAFTTQHTFGVVEMWLRNPRVFNWLNKQLRALRKEASRD